MAAIQKLSPEIIGQIAAGEVVERPASVVKELVENAIDAGATHVTVELRGGGIEYIRISDNGKGIPAEQIRLAFERHATSKLQRAEQLFDVHTLGFRGEALASVAAVAKVSCTTKTQEAAFGVRCTVEGGEFTDIRQAASPVGTTFVVEDLFFNTPVRRKFLKKPALEAAMVSDYMLRLILSQPKIAFRFVSQGKTVYHSMGDGKLESALFCLYGKEALQQMLPVQGTMNGIILHGYVGVGELSRGNRQQQSFFVNGRYFRSGILSRALEAGCEGRVMIGKFPMCALYLEVSYQSVDVNVHPNKLEVRFQNEAAVGEAIQALVSDAMHAKKLGESLVDKPTVPSIQPTSLQSGFTVLELNQKEEEKPQPIEKPPVEKEEKQVEPQPEFSEIPPDERPVLQPIVLPANETGRAVLHETPLPAYAARRQIENKLQQYTTQMEERKPEPVAAPPEKQEEPLEQTTLLEEQTTEAAPRFVGIVFDTYWIFEAENRLLLLDQHAAHERILFDRLMKQMEGDQISQRLLSPQLVRLSAGDMALALELKELFWDAGFQLEPFDDENIAIHAIPTLFGHNDDPKALFLEALDDWQSGRGQLTKERMHRQIAQMACKHAIKGGDQLNQRQIDGFLKEMLQSESMPTCPHGRPIVIEVSRNALEKRFKRIQ
ncbi:MAG: DNA mismatch repair endonuclease MutL [Eubacteriales bacterium]|nr:DNA mismatch repair endonuclease MutL [Eubacteriales bacterium]